jgi:hypothetical protein
MLGDVNFKLQEREERRFRHTVSEHKLRNTSNVHRNRPKEVIISTQADETLWRDGALEAAEYEDGGGVGN